MEKEKRTKVSYRFSTLTVRRIEALAKKAELNRTETLEQLIKREAQKRLNDQN